MQFDISLLEETISDSIVREGALDRHSELGQGGW